MINHQVFTIAELNSILNSHATPLVLCATPDFKTTEHCVILRKSENFNYSIANQAIIPINDYYDVDLDSPENIYYKNIQIASEDILVVRDGDVSHHNRLILELTDKPLYITWIR